MSEALINLGITPVCKGLFFHCRHDGRRAFFIWVSRMSGIPFYSARSMLNTADDGLKMIHEGSKAIAEAAGNERYKAEIKKGEKKAYYSAIESARHATRMLGMLTGTPLQGIEMAVRPHLPSSTTGGLSDDALSSGIATRMDVLARLQPNPTHIRVSEIRETGLTRAELLKEKRAEWNAEVDDALQWFRDQGTKPKEIREAYKKSEEQRIRNLQTDFLSKRRTRSEVNAHSKRLWDFYRGRLNRINSHLKKLGS